MIDRERLGAPPIGVGVAVLNNYFGREWVILLGKEVSGRYSNQYNLCAGKLEYQDSTCYIIHNP